MHAFYSEIGLLDEIEAATASITRQSSEEDTDDIVNSTTLEHCAEQILSGIKKEVEVQYLVPMMVSNGTCQGTQQQNTTQTTNFDCTIKESGTLCLLVRSFICSFFFFFFIN